MTYRTRNTAGRVIEMPDRDVLAVPSKKEFRDCLLFGKSNGPFFMRVISPQVTSEVEFNQGKVYIDGFEQPFSEKSTVYAVTNIEKLDIPLLVCIYSIIYYDREKEGFSRRENDEITIYIPDLIRYTGGAYKQSQKNFESVIRRMEDFKWVVGIEKNYDQSGYKIFPVLQVVSVDITKNTVKFTAQYLDHIVLTIQHRSVRKNGEGTWAKKDEHGHYKFYPTHTHLVKSSIVREKNKAAVICTFIIAVLIEQAGSSGYAHISVKTLVSRNAMLKARLSRIQSVSDRNKLLKRVLKKTFDLLDDQTELFYTYADLQIDDEDPGASVADKVYGFSHNGK